MKKISLFFIRRPVATSLLVIFFLASGIYSYNKMPVSDLPAIGFPVMVVSAFYPGASPDIMAEAVATPLEQELMKISGIKTIISQSSDSFTNIILTFDIDKNIDLLTPDVEAAISRAKGNLPNLPDDPTFSKYNPSEKPIMFITVDSDSLSHGELFDIANKRISQPLSMLQGISNVTIWSVSSAIRIKVDPNKLAEFKITLPEVSSAIYNNTMHASGGSLEGDLRTFAIVPDGQLTTPEEYNNIIIKSVDGKPVKISDIGHAYTSQQQENYRLKFYDSKSKKFTNPILMSITKKPEANIIDLSNSIKREISSLRDELPNSVKINLIYDKSSTVIKSINDVKNTMLIALALVVIVLFIFMGRLTDTLIPAVILPVSVVTTFLVMYFLGFSIDNLSLMAITLAIGFVVDDAIVVFENTLRHIESGETPFTAAVNSVREITGSVVAMTLSIAIVFVPIIFLSGIVGWTFREFALTVIIIVACSGVLSLTLTPMMNANLLKSFSKSSKKNKIRSNVNLLLSKVIRIYGKSLTVFIKKPSISVIIWLGCILLSVALYVVVPKTFMPNGDSGSIMGSIQVPVGTSQKPIQKYQDKIDKVLANDQAIENFFTITGIYSGADKSLGKLAIMLKPNSNRANIAEVTERIRKKLSDIPFNLGEVYLSPVPVLELNTEGNTTAAGAKYSYILTSTQGKNVFKYAELLKQRMQNSPEFVDVQSDVKINLPKLDLKINREKALNLGISISDIQSTLLSAYSLGRAAQFTIGPNPYDVILQVGDQFRKKPSDLSLLYIKSSITGKSVPLGTIASWTEKAEPSTITHYHQLDAATISFNLAGEVSLGQATNKIESLSKELLPSSVTGHFQGEARQFVNSENSFIALILIAIFLLYILLGILYESYIHPLTVLTTLPTATVGGLGALLLFNSQLTIYSYIGLLLLLGIVVKNGIMLVDFAVQKLKNRDIKPAHAIYEACIIRFRPILLTGLTSIVGAVPIAFGFGTDASLRRPLGIVIIGGLIVSQIVTLYVTPGIFIYMQKFQAKYLSWKKKKPKSPRAAGQ